MKKDTFLRLFILLLFCSIQITNSKSSEQEKKKISEKQSKITNNHIKHSFFAGGCFWCTEAMFEQLRGVISVQSGYTGGFVTDPTYQQVKKGQTGHSQVIKITYNDTKISFEELLYIFMHAHDPTTYHRQGIDSGSQYRSAVYYQTESELRSTKRILKQIQQAKTYNGAPQQILTQIALFGKFYPAQKYHQNYFTQNPYDSQCSAIIAPKIQKMRKIFKQYYQEL